MTIFLFLFLCKLDAVLIISTATCTGLPGGKNWRTEASFPVMDGTLIFVACTAGHSLTKGDTAITCDKGSEFIFGDEPICELGNSCNLHFFNEMIC